MSAKEIPFGKIIKDQIYLNAWGEEADRVIGTVKGDDEEASIAYFQQRFEELRDKVKEVKEEIAQSTNKGSFLMKLVHLRESLKTHEGLGDYQALNEQLLQEEAALNDLIEKNRNRNTEIKQELLAELKAAVQKINWKEATLEINALKDRWIKTGNADDASHEALENEFWDTQSAFFEKKQQFYEDKKLLSEKRKKAYEAIVQQAEKLTQLEGAAKFDKIKELRNEWSEVGHIRKEDYDPLFNRFKEKISLAKKASSQPTIDISQTIAQLIEAIEGKKFIPYKEINAIRESLKKVRSSEASVRQQKKEAFGLLQLLLERDFLDKLASKRFKDFRSMERAKKRQIRIGILHELIDRDQADLKKYQENSANFSFSGGKGAHLIDKKLEQQKGKIATKEKLLKLLKEES